MNELEDEIEDDADFDEEIEQILEEKPKRGRKPKNKDTENYVNNEEMWNEIIRYYQLLGDNYNWTTQEVVDKKDTTVDISHTLSLMIHEIATRIGYRPNFLNYSFLSEMRGDAQLKMVKALRDGSFKCFHTTEIIDTINKDGVDVYYFYDKKNRLKSRKKEATDVFFEKDGKKFMTFRQSPFAYYTHISFNSFLNRIRKEKLANTTKLEYQETVWENILATEQWSGVRRPRHMDSDENDSIYE